MPGARARRPAAARIAPIAAARARRGGRSGSLGLLASLALWGCSAVSAIDTAPRWPTPIRGMVVSEHPLATAVGRSVLEDGGNAADAAVATALALAVVYPQAGNLGGGGFAVWVPHDGEPRALDFRETAPRSGRADRYRVDGRVDAGLSQTGALAVGVPGSPAGLWELHLKLGSGRFDFEDLAAPAIALANDGFAVDVHLESALRSQKVRARMERSPAARRTFYPGGIPLRQGQLLVQPELGRTLRTFAQAGPRAFYRGDNAERLVREVDRLMREDDLGGGWIDAEDLAGYRPVWRTPLRGWFRGREIVTMPPPSSGGILLLQVLSVLEGLPLEAERERVLETASFAGTDLSHRGYGPALGIDDRILHWWIEALRWAFAGRAEYMGDPDFVDVPVRELLSPEWIATCRVSIEAEATPDLKPWLPDLPPESTETTHLSVLDEDGNAVSLTTTLNSSFGSGVVVEGGGYLLNNEMDDFALPDGVANQFGLVGSSANWPAPNKRPLSSMTPTVVRDGGSVVTIVIGSPGGPRIISSVIGVLLRILLFEEDLETAVAAPRVHQQWRPPHSEFEAGWDRTLIESLATRRGHEVRIVEKPWASVQVIQCPVGGEPIGVSDSRRGGAALAQRKDD